MKDSEDEKSRKTFHETQQPQPAQVPYEELRKRIKVYPKGAVNSNRERVGEALARHSHVDSRVKGLYQEILGEPIPSQMQELINRLKAKERE